MIRSDAPLMVVGAYMGAAVGQKPYGATPGIAHLRPIHPRGERKEVRRSMSTAGRPTAGRVLPRPHAWSVLLCLSLIAGLLFLPSINANAASFVVTTPADTGTGSLR